MTKTSEPIVFFGSGPVAAASLRLLAQDFAIEAVITKPRPPHHRGDVPVIATAEALGLPIFTATNRKSLDELFATKPVRSRVAILIDFGIIVSQNVIDYFPMGIINSHFSLLPEWRGADPITFAILSGQQQTGVSLMMLVAAMDEGPILAQRSLPLDNQTTTPELTDKLIILSHQLLVAHVGDYLDGSLTSQPQDDSNPTTYSRKLSKADSIADWRKPAAQVEREIRAFIEWPRTRTTFGGLEVILTKAHVIDAQGQPGTVAVIDKLPIVYCGSQALAIERIKPAGKQEMTGEAFLAGYKHFFLSA
jgi:methionyl-tRNA formyltransferase